MTDFGQIPNSGQAPSGNIQPQPNAAGQIHIGSITPPGAQAPQPPVQPQVPAQPPQAPVKIQPPTQQAAPPVAPPQQTPPPTQANQTNQRPTHRDEPWKTLPPDQCAYRKDGKCIGADECLRKCDSWGQLRAINKYNFSERYAVSKSPKEAHIFFRARKLMEVEDEGQDKKLDMFVRRCRECAYHKVLDDWDDPDLEEDGDGQTGWSSLV